MNKSNKFIEYFLQFNECYFCQQCKVFNLIVCLKLFSSISNIAFIMLMFVNVCNPPLCCGRHFGLTTIVIIYNCIYIKTKGRYSKFQFNQTMYEKDGKK